MLRTDALLYTLPMPLTATPRVFLSYPRKDGEAFATALRRRLAEEEPEITLWQDRGEMEGGVGWWQQIEAALDQVKFLVIVITPQAITSQVTWQEWRFARQKGVNVYPVKGVSDDKIDYETLPNLTGFVSRISSILGSGQEGSGSIRRNGKRLSVI